MAFQTPTVSFLPSWFTRKSQHAFHLSHMLHCTLQAGQSFWNWSVSYLWFSHSCTHFLDRLGILLVFLRKPAYFGSAGLNLTKRVLRSVAVGRAPGPHPKRKRT